MATRSVVVVSAGLGQPSSTRLLADRLAAATVGALRAEGADADAHVLELREHAQDLTNNLLTAFPSPRLREAIEALRAADGLIAVSPIFSASYSGLFKVFFDVVERDGLAGMPVLVAATGGTPRHSLALDHAFRPLFAYLGAAVVPTAVYAASSDWGGSGDELDDGLVERIERAGRELASAIAGRWKRALVDPYAAPTPFEDLLGGIRPEGRRS